MPYACQRNSATFVTSKKNLPKYFLRAVAARLLDAGKSESAIIVSTSK
jgi:hypothetical protein